MAAFGSACVEAAEASPAAAPSSVTVDGFALRPPTATTASRRSSGTSACTTSRRRRAPDLLVAAGRHVVLRHRRRRDLRRCLRAGVDTEHVPASSGGLHVFEDCGDQWADAILTITEEFSSENCVALAQQTRCNPRAPRCSRRRPAARLPAPRYGSLRWSGDSRSSAKASKRARLGAKPSPAIASKLPLP